MILKTKIPKSPAPMLTYCIEIRPNGPVKIGRSRQIVQRMGAGAAFNDQLKLLATFPDKGDTSEAAIHKKFEMHRLKGELFDGDVIREWLSTIEFNV